MTERFFLALTLLAALAVAGMAVRVLSRRRQRWLASLVRLDGAATRASGSPRVVAFSGPGCAACGVQRRILDALDAEWGGLVMIDHFDAVDQRERAREFGVVIVPTTVVAAPDGRVVSINNGLIDLARLRDQVRDAAGLAS